MERHHSIENEDPCSHLREYLSLPPSVEVFQKIVDYWNGIQAIDQSNTLFNYLLLHLQDWPDEMCFSTIDDCWPSFPEGEPLPFFIFVRNLDLEDKRIGPAGVEILVQSSYLTGIRILNLGTNHIGPQGMLALANSPSISELRSLDLFNNKLGNEGIAAIVKSPYLFNLERLALNNNSLNHSDCIALANCKCLPRLRYLETAGNGLSIRCAQVILDSETLSPDAKASFIAQMGDSWVPLNMLIYDGYTNDQLKGMSPADMAHLLVS